MLYDFVVHKFGTGEQVILYRICDIIIIRENDLKTMIQIWNEVVEDGVAFPQDELLTEESGKEFFRAQTYSAVAKDKESGEVYEEINDRKWKNENIYKQI